MIPINEHIIERNLGELCMEYDKIHGANINLARITPDLIDGLKPVQRRAIYAMYLNKQGRKPKKVASIAGDTFAKFSPHTPVSTEDAIVKIAQEWNNNIPLITGLGNFGDPSGSVAGASRYIQAKLSDFCLDCFFDDWKYSVVDMDMAYDEETLEPKYLPAKYPIALLNGSLGIGYGLGSNIPAYNFKELIDTTIRLMRDPNSRVILIPDSPSGADIIEADFATLSNRSTGSYYQRCKYEIDPERNVIRITSLPYQVTAIDVRERIADIKEKGGLPELNDMSDLSGKTIDIQLHIRDDVNPYKFMRKLIDEVGGLEKSYSINITVVNDLETFDWSVKQLLEEWIKWRREQKRIVVSHKRTSLLAEQRMNDVKIFIMDPERLDETIAIFRSSRNRAATEKGLLEKYRNSEIMMDSLQARTISDLHFYELCIETYEACLKKRDELIQEIMDVERSLSEEDGIDKLIIAELREGVKKFGTPRRSNVVPKKISIKTKVEGECILQLSSDGMILRKEASNVYEEPIPTDTNGFAVKVTNDSAFILVDQNGYHCFIKVNNIPLDAEVPVNRYAKQKLTGNIVAMLPYDIDSDRSCTLISSKGITKRIRISDLGPSKRPIISLSKGDTIVRGIVTRINSSKNLLIYTKEGMGQRLDPNVIRITSPNAKGTSGFKLKDDDEIVGCFDIRPNENQYLLYITAKGRMRLNLIDYLPTRDSKHDEMVRLITLNDRDKLVSIIGCNKMDKVKVFYDNAITEIIEVKKLEESTMSSEPKKVTVNQNAVTTNIVKAKLE